MFIVMINKYLIKRVAKRVRGLQANGKGSVRQRQNFRPYFCISCNPREVLSNLIDFQCFSPIACQTMAGQFFFCFYDIRLEICNISLFTHFFQWAPQKLRTWRFGLHHTYLTGLYQHGGKISRHKLPKS